jgi:hypothetical protein
MARSSAPVSVAAGLLLHWLLGLSLLLPGCERITGCHDGEDYGRAERGKHARDEEFFHWDISVVLAALVLVGTSEHPALCQPHWMFYLECPEEIVGPRLGNGPAGSRFLFGAAVPVATTELLNVDGEISWGSN